MTHPGKFRVFRVEVNHNAAIAVLIPTAPAEIGICLLSGHVHGRLAILRETRGTGAGSQSEKADGTSMLKNK